MLLLNCLRPDTVAIFLSDCGATVDTVLEQNTTNPFEIRVVLGEDETLRYIYLSCDDPGQIEISDGHPFDATEFEPFIVPSNEWLDEYNKVADEYSVPVILKYEAEE